MLFLHVSVVVAFLFPCIVISPFLVGVISVVSLNVIVPGVVGFMPLSVSVQVSVFGMLVVCGLVFCGSFLVFVLFCVLVFGGVCSVWFFSPVIVFGYSVVCSGVVLVVFRFFSLIILLDNSL